MASKNSVKITYKQKPVLTRVREMIGRVLEDRGLFTRNSLTWALYTTGNSIDYSQVNYFLTRAVFYASEVQSPLDGKKYGKDFLLGAGFAKPIVNSAAAFAVGKLPEVKSNKNEDQATEINKWMEEEKSNIFYAVRNSMRDGDSYFRLDPDLEASLVAPHKVTVVNDPISGKLIGYNITSYVKNDDNNKLTKYVEELRTTTPFRQVKKYEQDKKTGEVMADSVVSGEEGEERPLDLIHFSNEKEPDQQYGNTEYQNCFIYFHNYHEVFENLIRNNIYNSNAVPVFEGIENMSEFLEANGERQDDGTYRMKWNPENLIVGGKGFNAKILQGVSNANDGMIVLNILFWLIAQTSETPEFVFGTAVTSSKASVSEQMPIALKKAERKQTQLNTPFKQLINLYNYHKSKLDQKKFKADMEYELKWLPILDDDLKLNLEIVKVLSEQGCITDSTKLLLLSMGRYIEDFDDEIANARKEMEEKNAAAAQVDGLLGQPAEEESIIEGDDPEAEDEPLTPEEEALANTPAS